MGKIGLFIWQGCSAAAHRSKKSACTSAQRCPYRQAYSTGLASENSYYYLSIPVEFRTPVVNASGNVPKWKWQGQRNRNKEWQVQCESKVTRAAQLPRLCELSLCYSQCLPVPRSHPRSWVVPGQCLHRLPNRPRKHQEPVPEPGSLTAVLLRPEVIFWHLWTSPCGKLGRYSPECPRIREDHGKAQAGFVTVEDYLLLIHIFSICLQVCFPLCTPQKFLAKDQQNSVI